MVGGPKLPRGNRQNGRYDKDKDVRSNRKTKKTKKQEEKLLEEQENAAEKLLYPDKFDDTPLTVHEKVIEARPTTPPTWYEKQLAMTPSKSYVKLSKDKDD